MTGPPEPESYPQATPPPADPDHVRKVMAWMAQQLDANRQPQDPAARKRAGEIPCPYCGARPRKPCWQTFRGKPLASGKTMTDPHPHRVRAAEREPDE